MAITNKAAPQSTRIGSIDIMRGLVMLFMLVDHVRETVYLHLQVSDPMNVDTTQPALFFTRMCAHLCAPTFVFLTGLGAWLYAHPNNAPERSASGFLFKRGLLLVFLEITVVSFSWTGVFPPTHIWLQVIWVIGLSMIALSLIVRLPYLVIAAIGATLVFGHNLLTPISFQPGEPGYALWTILHDRGFLTTDGPLIIKVSYPLLPWIGVICLGYVAGPIFSGALTTAQRRRALLLLGIASLLVLLALRGFNIYGETQPWLARGDLVHTIMDWLNFTKYPPSLAFLLLTLGIAFLLLRAFDGVQNRATEVVRLFGGAPMFFYILHLYALLVFYKLGLAIVGPNVGERFGVPYVYQVWLVALVFAVVLYFPTRAFAQYKRRTTRAWVRYF